MSEVGVCGQLEAHVRLAQQGGLAQHSHRSGRQLLMTLDCQGHYRGVAVEVDVGDAADLHISYVDGLTGHQVADIAETRLEMQVAFEGTGRLERASGEERTEENGGTGEASHPLPPGQV